MDPRERAARELAAIVESSDDAIISKDLKGTIRSWNRGAERMFGYTAAEAIGQSIHIVVPEGHWSEEDEVLHHLRRGEKVEHFETVRQRKDGSFVDVSLTVSPIRNVNGTVVGASGIARNVSERKQVEREHEQLLQRAQSAGAEFERISHLKDDFLAVLSHELRTPLNAVLGYAQLLASGSLPPDRAAHALLAIQRNAQAQARLVDSLMDLSRLIAGKFELKVSDIELVSVLDAAIEAVQPEADANGISLDFTKPANLIHLAGDEPRLEQVFWNLLSNAIKFTPRNGRVALIAIGDNGTARIQVTDTGEGIAADFLPQVFDRFKQAENGPRRSQNGLGLGLSLVREIVHAHGGTIVAESPGERRGSTFTVTLPLTRVAKSLGTVAAAPEHADAV